jgi:hypothetical protein
MPDNDKLKVLVEHKVIATFQDVKFRTCWGLTGKCPERCGSSGEYANFKITDYLHYQKLGKYGDDKQWTYSVHVTDFHRKPIGDLVLGAYINTLEAGDEVVIEWAAPGTGGIPQTATHLGPQAVLQDEGEGICQADPIAPV